MNDPIPLCRAPSAALRLDPGGWATACAANERQRLGNIADHTLAELWGSPAARELRAQLASGQYGPGCRLCRWQHELSGVDTAYARIYDRFEAAAAGGDDDQPDHPVNLELSLSNRCNLRCIMCNGYLSSSIRTGREGLEPLSSAYPERFYGELAEWLPGLQQLKFLGGEPFLAPEHHRVWDLMIERDLRIDSHVTTNATVWNAAVERVLDHIPTSLAVSIDGVTAETVETIREGASLTRILQILDRLQAYTEAAGTYLGLTFCLMRQNWHELADFLRFADGRDLEVFVNTVVTPGRFSLYRLPKPELQAIVEQLEQDSPEVRASLGRNGPVWDEQLKRLRAQLSAPPPDPSRVRDVTVALPVVPAAEGPVALGAWAHSSAVELTLDGAGIVQEVSSPATLAGLDLGHVVGSGADEVNVLLRSAFGIGDGMAHDPLAVEPESVTRSTSYSTASLRTEVRSEVLDRREDGGHRVALAVRREARTAEDDS